MKRQWVICLAILTVWGFVLSAHAQTVPAYVQANVPESQYYNVVYELDIPNSASYNSGSIPYLLDDHASVPNGSFSRVAYYLQLDGLWIWVSFNSAGFTSDAGKIGVPNLASGELYQQNVSNLNVASNVAGIATGTGLSGGNLEFWPSNYSGINSGVPNASSSAYDFGDSGTGPGSGYGSMQIHNHYVTPTTGQTLFAFNRWGNAGGNLDIGIGNRPATADTDWTFAQNAAVYTNKKLLVMVQPSPGISLVTLTNGTDNNAGTGPLVQVGSTVTWTYQVTNTGNAPVGTVTVTDDQVGFPVYLGGDTNGNGWLDLTETWFFSAAGTAIAGQYTNTGTASGYDPFSQRVTASDPDHYLGLGPFASKIIVDPADSAKLYAGLDTGGIWWSADGGGAWTEAATQPANNRLKDLVMHPTDHSILYAATYGGGIFKSIDSADNWTSCANTNLGSSKVVSLAIDATGKLYAGTEAGIFTSTDCAAWSEANGGLLVDAAKPPVTIVIDPETSSTVYTGLDGAGVYKMTATTDWTAATTQPANLNIKAIVIKPGDSTKLFAGSNGGGVFKSENSGAGWTVCTDGTTANSGLGNLNVLSLTITANGTLYTGTEAGVFISTDGCATWTALNTGLPN